MYVTLNEQEYDNIRKINNKIRTFHDSLTFSIAAKRAKASECQAIGDVTGEKIAKHDVDLLLSVIQTFDEVMPRGIEDVTFK